MAAAAIASLGNVNGRNDGYLRQLARTVQAEAAQEAAELQGVRQDVCDVLTANASKAEEALLRAAKECEDTAERIDAEADALTLAAEQLVAAEASRCVARLRAAHQAAQAHAADTARGGGRTSGDMDSTAALARERLSAAVSPTGSKAALVTARLCTQAGERIRDLAARNSVLVDGAPRLAGGLRGLAL